MITKGRVDNMAYTPYNRKGERMKKYEIIFYEKADGEKPVEEFLLNLEVKMRAKMGAFLQLLEEKGNLLREPYSKHLDDGIFEIRCSVGNNTARALYFFYHGGKIIVTNGFIKKQQKTPNREIYIAKKRRIDYLERVSKDENIK